jgi:hypothetical protein
VPRWGCARTLRQGAAAGRSEARPYKREGTRGMLVGGEGLEGEVNQGLDVGVGFGVG